LEQEESGFGATYEAGMARIEDLLGKGDRAIAGAEAFMLHDTYGFPIELTEEIAAGRGVSVDRDGFEQAMDAQRERARGASKFAKAAGGERGAWTAVSDGPHSAFTGWTSLREEGLAVRRFRERGEELELVLDRTPFYAESGGQVADRGVLHFE